MFLETADVRSQAVSPLSHGFHPKLQDAFVSDGIKGCGWLPKL